MKPFLPARVVGGTVVAEREPFAFEASASFRGVEVLSTGQSAGPHRTSSSLRRVVVREPHEFVQAEDHFLSLFQNTVAETARLAGSPAARILHTFGRDGRVHAMVVEHVDGTALDHIIRTLRAREELLEVPVALAIARALVALWTVAGPVEIYLGIADVLITPSGRVRASPELASERARQVVGAAVGLIEARISYIAPEQVRGEGSVEQSGMFTLGLVLYEMLVGRHPVESAGMPTFEVLARMARGALPKLSELRPDVPAGVASFVDRAVAADPAARFASWPELASCLAAVRSAFDPTGPAQILASLPDDVRPMEESWPGLGALDLGHLPHSGWIEVPTPELPRAADESTRPVALVDPRLVYGGTDHRPMYRHGDLLMDARPVTAAELERFVIATSAASGQDAGEEPCTMVPFEQAEAYARWAGKRLPTDAEWTVLVDAIGADELAVGSVWEWTATPRETGRVVRGGRWRDAWERPPSPENRSHEDDPAPDVGFRCVCEAGRSGS